jgi:toxin ParE1/3/4
MAFKIKTEPEAHQDIQEGIDWYNKQQPGLGRKFHAAVKASFKSLKTNPFFQARYDNVRCLPLKTYPYMIHFTLNEEDKIIVVRAVFDTSRDPELWTKR